MSQLRQNPGLGPVLTQFDDNPLAEGGSMSERQVLNKTNLGITEGLPLQASQGGIEELRADIQRLMDMEAMSR